MALKEVKGEFMDALKHQEKLLQTNKHKIAAGGYLGRLTEVETLHGRKERNAQIHMDTVEEKLRTQVERNVRNIRNSVDLSRLKLLEKIARLEVFFKEGVRQACTELKETLEENFTSKPR